VLFVHTVDPVILFYGFGSRHGFTTESEGFQVHPGDQYYYRAGLGFAVNEKLTLSSSLTGWYIADPVRGNVRPTIPEFCGQWQKGAILVVKKDAQPREWSPLSIRADEVRLGETTDQWLRGEINRPAERQSP
jgi:hypothetical protein